MALILVLFRQNGKQIFSISATSNMLGAVNARFLADFELTLLSVEDQRKISQFNLLAKRERQLLRMLADEKEKYYAGVLNQAYKRAKKGK